MDINKKIDQIIDEIKKDCDITEHDDIIREIYSKDPLKFISALLFFSKKSFIEIQETINTLEFNKNNYFIEIKNLSIEIYKKAILKNPSVFKSAMDSFSSNTEYQMNILQLIPTIGKQYDLNLNNINIVKDHIKKLYDYYDLEIKEFIAYAQIINNKPHKKSDIEQINKKNWNDILSNSIKNGNQILLDDDYRHIRNSIAHGTYTISNRKKTIKFSDVFLKNRWEKTYSYEKLLIVLYTLYLWVWAINYSKFKIFIAILKSYLLV